MLRVAHIRDTFLRPTETFIYDIYSRHRTIEPFFLCERLSNTEQFPAKNVYAISSRGNWYSQTQEVTRRLIGEFPFYTKMCKEFRIDLIHAHFGPSGYYACTTKKKTGIPLITSFYGQDVFEIPSTDRWKRHYAELFETADLILSLSADMTKDLISIGCPAEKIKVYRLGIDLQDFSPVPMRKSDTIKVLTIARLVEKKGIDVLIRAVALLSKRLPSIRLRIIGDGPLLEPLRELAEELVQIERVDFAGRVPFANLPQEISDSDIFCLPSVTDRFGGKDEISMVLKEAMGMAVPIVATYHAGIPEVIEDHVNGLLVPERSPDRLAAALGELADQPALREKLGKAGRALVERVWEINRQVDLIENIYHEVARK